MSLCMMRMRVLMGQLTKQAVHLATDGHARNAPCSMVHASRSRANAIGGGSEGDSVPRNHLHKVRTKMFDTVISIVVT